MTGIYGALVRAEFRAELKTHSENLWSTIRGQYYKQKYDTIN